MGLFWFWWIALSLQHYGYAWGLPLGMLLVSLAYGLIFWGIAALSSRLARYTSEPMQVPLKLLLLALALLGFSYFHPLHFDWHKPELMFLQSYLGIEKWQFAIILFSIALSIWREKLYWLLLILLAYDPIETIQIKKPQDIVLLSSTVSVQDKWNIALQPAQFEKYFTAIDKAIAQKKKLIILPESSFPLFLNHTQALIDRLKEKAQQINIVTGGLYYDGKVPKNATYIFEGDKITVANKVLLVPFGESNPLPDFLSDWVNDVFYDGSIDYQASPNVVNYTLGGRRYRNAICFEATSEKLYEGRPKEMIVISNNGWFTPSIEPTLQKLLLLYYSKKYDTTIYHSINMSPSYVLSHGQEIK